MGNICSVSISCDAIFSRCVQCFITKASYISQLQDNLLLLPSELQKLIDVRNDVMRRVIFDERSLKMKRTDQVQGWLSRVQAAENQVAELQKLKDEETQKLCLGGYCSNNCKSSYNFGKRVHKMLQELTTLKCEADFKNVAEKMPEDPVDEMPIDPTIIGLQSTFDKVWSCLGDQQAGIIGLYGMGGVGKTTLLTQINNKFRDTPNDFDVVIWVVEKGKLLVQTSVGLTEAPETEKWEGVKRMSLMGNQIENLFEIPSCPHLSTLFLNKNSLQMINNDFFRFMPSLKVLNLSSNNDLAYLSLEISRLVSLQHLDLSGTKIKELPEELKALANLRCLNLGNMCYLHRVPRRLISSFVKLRIFRLFGHSWELGPVGDNVLSGGGEYLVQELLCLKYLKALSIQLNGSCALGKFLKSQKLQSCTQFLHLEGLEESLAVSSLTGMKHLYNLTINSYGLEVLKIDYCPVEIQKIRESHCFHSLGNVIIFGCIRLRDATWLVFAPNLKDIIISYCVDMEEVISVEKCGQLIRVLGCPSLEKLPLDFNNVKERKIVFEVDTHLLEELKREDPPTYFS
ncbi:hypothetical protein EZV62_004216 [Acer yangbiense]|uniref:NB-ARC domain-containing protein n=1 Tax=Acer yangbiense TaxID=1000413 RepID=A0A5C7IJE4_9ROSI|nr:hypothetical protein EZV62_004216 [Acer yangbiense]